MKPLLKNNIIDNSFKYINERKIKTALVNFKNQKPFDHCIIDNFFSTDVAYNLEQDFLPYDDEQWHHYNNPLEDKKALNNWGLFPELTYNVFAELNSQEFLSLLGDSLHEEFFNDPGLHGGGWHIHTKGGNLNPHLDYSIHPKLKLERKINIIIYLSSKLEKTHGGHLGLWRHDNSINGPGELIKSVEPKFNRAIIFDTTQNSWHGMSNPMTQPKGIFRKSIAVYYLRRPTKQAANRVRALFAPREDQKNDLSIYKLIAKRSDLNLSPTVYNTAIIK